MDITAFEIFLKVQEIKAESTIDDMLRTLRRMRRRGFNPDQIQDQDANATFLAAQRHRGKSEYKKNVQVVNAILRFVGNPHKFPYPSKKRAIPQRLRPWEIERLRAFGHKDPLIVLRNRALIAFALQTGLRRSECARVNIHDFDPDEMSLSVPSPAKNGQARIIPLDPEFVAARSPFMIWLRARPIPESDNQAVWIAMPDGRQPNRISETKLGALMTKIGKDCGVPANFVRTRHTRATELLQRGIHIRALQHYLGHADLKSTMVYLEMDDLDLKSEFERTRRRKK